MDLRSDLPFWLVRNGLTQIYPSLERDERCEVIIVGGGVTGALVAHEFSKRGIETVLIDRRHIAFGSTSASTGLLQYEIDTPLHELSRIHNRALAERSYWLGVEAIDDIRRLAGKECGFAARTSLLLAKNARHIPGLRREYDARKSAQLKVEWLDRSRLAQAGLHREAAIESRVGAEVDPYRLTHRLLTKARRLGLRAYDRTEMTSFEEEKRAVVVRTPRGKIRASKVFFATGYEVVEILPRDLVRLASTYAFISEPLSRQPPWPSRSLLWHTGLPYLYARTTEDNRIIVGGADDRVVDGDRRDRQVGKKARMLRRQFLNLCPGLTEVEPAFSWAGMFGSTKDGLAYIGSLPRFPRSYFALGFGGNGITFSATAARILADLHQGKQNADARIFRFDR